MSSNTKYRIECIEPPGIMGNKALSIQGNVTPLEPESRWKMGKYEIHVFSLAVINLSLRYAWVMIDKELDMITNPYTDQQVLKGEFEVSASLMSVHNKVDRPFIDKFKEALEESIFRHPFEHLLARILDNHFGKSPK